MTANVWDEQEDASHSKTSTLAAPKCSLMLPNVNPTAKCIHYPARQPNNLFLMYGMGAHYYTLIALLTANGKSKSDRESQSVFRF